MLVYTWIAFNSVHQYLFKMVQLIYVLFNRRILNNIINLTLLLFLCNLSASLPWHYYPLFCHHLNCLSFKLSCFLELIKCWIFKLCQIIKIDKFISSYIALDAYSSNFSNLFFYSFRWKPVIKPNWFNCIWIWHWLNFNTNVFFY